MENHFCRILIALFWHQLQLRQYSEGASLIKKPKIDQISSFLLSKFSCWEICVESLCYIDASKLSNKGWWLIEFRDVEKHLSWLIELEICSKSVFSYFKTNYFIFWYYNCRHNKLMKPIVDIDRCLFIVSKIDYVMTWDIWYYYISIWYCWLSCKHIYIVLLLLMMVKQLMNL